MRSEALPIPGLFLDRSSNGLHLWSDEPLRVLSSAVAGADLAQTCHILNLGVHKDYNGNSPADDLASAASDLGLGDSPFVGLLTAARLDRAQVVVEQDEHTQVVAVVTVGVSRPTAAGVTEAFRPDGPGTINIILAADARLTRAAAVNAVITATEAKTLALVEAGVRAPHGGPASGTATDSIVVAWTGRGARHEYAGPVSLLGALVGRAVRTAMLQSLNY
jgi:iron complex transport system ATP-binding protein